jgi:hypothetical protein
MPNHAVSLINAIVHDAVTTISPAFRSYDYVCLYIEGVL